MSLYVYQKPQRIVECMEYLEYLEYLENLCHENILSFHTTKCYNEKNYELYHLNMEELQ